MFEKEVAYYLNRYLGKYVTGIDQESLRLSVWKGDVELRNLSLRPEALADLDLPITLRAGLLGRLTVKVPWARLGQQPVVVEFDRLYILAGPRGESTLPVGQDLTDFVASATAAEAQVKRALVDAAEAAWLQAMQDRQAGVPPGPGDGGQPAIPGQQSLGVGNDAAGPRRSRLPSLQSLIDPILSNLQLVVTNVHIRYEDDSAWAGHTLALGAVLGRLAAQTVNAEGQPGWVSISVMQLLRKAITLSQLAVYLDVDRPLMALPEGMRGWNDLSPDQWDTMFLPEYHTAMVPGGRATSRPARRPSKSGMQSGAALPGLLALTTAAASGEQKSAGNWGDALGSMIYEHDYLILPMGGTLRYLRRGQSGPVGAESEEEAGQEWSLALEGLAVGVGASQYQGAQALAEFLDQLARAQPHRHLRPRCRPHIGQAARMWWWYAIRATCRQSSRSHLLGWPALKRITDMRKQYVPIYAAFLREGGALGACAATRELEAGVPAPTVVQFRRMAHVQAGTTTRKPGKAGAGGPQSKAPAATGPASGQRSWVQWMGLSGSSPAADAGAATAVVAPAEEGVLSEEAWEKLEELLAPTNASVVASGRGAPPYSVFMRASVSVASMSVRLTQAAASNALPASARAETKTVVIVMQAALQQLQCDMVLYSATTAWTLGVGAASISSPHGQLFHTGVLQAEPTSATGTQLLPPSRPDTPSSGAGAGLGLGNNQCISLRIVRSPQDAQADVVVGLAVAPSYITYLPAAVDAVGAFFTPHRDLEVATLQAQAAVQADALWRVASLRVAALAEASARPRIALELAAHAPKLALPDPGGRAVLLLDLGHLGLVANRDLGAQLPAAEAALYDCLTAELSRMSAHLIMCDDKQAFSWTKACELLAAQSSVAAGRGDPFSGASIPAKPSSAISGPQESTVGSTLVSICQPVSLSGSLNLARAVHPRYPQVRVQLSSSPLHLHVSPARLMHVMRCVSAVSASKAASPVAVSLSESGTPDMPPWIRDAEFQCTVSVLHWDTSQAAHATWHHRQCYVWRGRIFLTRAHHLEPTLTKAFWQGAWRLMLVPPEALGSPAASQLCVAIIPPTGPQTLPSESGEASAASALMHPETLVLRTQDPTSLRSALARSRATMQTVAGLLQGESNADVKEEPGADNTALSQEGDLLALMRHSEVLQLRVSVPEVAVHLAGRPAPTSLHTTGPDLNTTSTEMANDPGLSMTSAELFTFQEEVPLAIIRLQRAAVDVAYNEDRLRVGAAMREMMIDDQLMGVLDKGMSRMATSTQGGPAYAHVAAAFAESLATDNSESSEEDEGFFDAMASATWSKPLSTGVSPGSDSFTQAGAVGQESAASPEADDPLVWLSYTSWQPTSAKRPDVDTELSARLSGLTLTVHRPTVAALMSMGTDIGALSKSQLGGEEGPDGSANVPGDSDVEESSGEEQECVKVFTGDVAKPASSTRVLTRISLSMRHIELLLAYEGAAYPLLASASADTFGATLELTQDTMRMTASLDNLQAVCEMLPADCPHRTLCQLRRKGQAAASLITVNVVTQPRSALPEHYASRLPGTGIHQVMTVQLQLQAVELCYLQCTINHLLEYLAAMMAMMPQARLPPQSAAQSNPSAAPAVISSALLLDVDLAAPLIIMPKNKTSFAFLELDLGTLTLKNTVRWGETVPGYRLLLDDTQVSLRGLGLRVTDDGVAHDNCVHDLEGGRLELQLKRPVGWVRQRTGSGSVRGLPPSHLPAMQVSLSLPVLDLRVSDVEYHAALAILSGNALESLTLPRELALLHAKVLASVPAVELAEQVSPGSGSFRHQLRAPLLTAPPAQPGARSRNWSHLVAGCAASLPHQHDFTHSGEELLMRCKDTARLGVTLSVECAKLTLLRVVPGSAAPQPFAALQMQGLWLTYSASLQGAMWVKLALPTLTIHDLRPSTPKERSLVLATSAPANDGTSQACLSSARSLDTDSGTAARAPQLAPSLLFLDYRSLPALDPMEQPAQAQQVVRVRLQQPTLLLDLAFLLPLLGFVAPTVALQGAQPQPWRSYDIVLSSDTHVAKGDVFLSPQCRLLADVPGVKSFIYDGDGHTLVLPPELRPPDSIPVILVGSACRLQLRNVRVLHAGSLASCLQLGPGGQLLAQPEDQVQLVQDDARLTSPGNMGGSSRFSFEEQRLNLLPSSSPLPPLMFEVQLEVLGAVVQVLDTGVTAAPLTSKAKAGLKSDRGMVVKETAPIGPVYCLVFQTDLTLAAQLQDQDMAVQLSLVGLGSSCATSLAAPPILIKAQLPITSTTQDPARQQIVSEILKSCDVAISYTTSSSSVASDGSLGEGSTTLGLDATLLSFTLMPETLRLMLKLQSLGAATVIPPPSQPLLRTDIFERQWASGNPAQAIAAGAQQPSIALGTLSVDSTGSGGIDPWASKRGMAIWRPVVPQGYAALGDVAMAGVAAAPRHPVAVVSISSGLMAWPLGYDLAWAAEAGVAIWWPVAPPGYVALGCVASVDADHPPAATQVACIAEHACVDAHVSQCTLLCAAGNIWTVANCGATFVVARAEAHQPLCLRDFRLPLGFPPAALPAHEALVSQKSHPTSPSSTLMHKPTDALSLEADPPTTSGAVQSTFSPAASMTQATRTLQSRFLVARAQASRLASSSALTTTTTEFRRLWWDRNQASSPASNHASFWRPVPPRGYVALADCMVTGPYAPPQSVVVLRDTLSMLATGGQARPPLLIRPLGFARVWSDELRARAGDVRYLVLWRPVAPQGYVAFGCVVGFGTTPPAVGIVRCVRADAVSSVILSVPNPDWSQPSYRQRSSVQVWIADERLSSFVALSPEDPPAFLDRTFSKQGGGGRGARLEAWHLKLEDVPEARASQEGSDNGIQRSVTVDARISGTTLLLQSSQQVPLLEFALNDIKLGLGTEAEQNGLMRGFVFSTISLCSYSAGLCAWEPVVEPWQVLLHLDRNSRGSARAGVAPGTWLRLTSTQSTVKAALSQAAITSLLATAQHWESALQAGNEAGEQSITGPLTEGGISGVRVNNRLGTAVEIQLVAPADTQGAMTASQQAVVLIPSGEVLTLRQSIPRVPPPSPLMLSRRRTTDAPLPTPRLVAMRLVVDVLGLHLVHSGSLDGAANPPLVCALEVLGPAAELMTSSCWGCETRAVRVLGTGRSDSLGADMKGGAAQASWQERFLVPLPSELSSQMFSPVNYDSQFSGVPISLRFTVSPGDAAGSGVGSHAIAAACAGVEWDWLYNQASMLRSLAHHAAETGQPLGSLPSMLQSLPVQVLRGQPYLSDADEDVRLVVRLALVADQAESLGRSDMQGRVDSGGSSQRSGMRLIRLAGASAWVPLPSAGGLVGSSSVSPALQSAVTVTPLVVGNTTLAVESSLTPSGLHETLRSLCRLNNATGKTLEVSVLAGSDDVAWLMVPSLASAPGGGASSHKQVVEEEVFENERYVPTRGWSHSNLSASDRLRYNWGRGASSGEGDNADVFPQIPLPTARGPTRGVWEWEGSWEVECRGHVDSDGWAYGNSWAALAYPFTLGCGMYRPTDLVRRRRWVRRRVFHAASQQAGDRLSSHALQARRVTVGVLTPGSSLSLPLGWDADGNELQVRPLLLDPRRPSPSEPIEGVVTESSTASPPLLLGRDGHVLHSWSTRPGTGATCVGLPDLQEGATHLVCCAVSPLDAAAACMASHTSAPPAAGQSQTQETALASVIQPHWLSITVECDALVATHGGLDLVLDWRLAVRPPLLVHNSLPVPARYVVWERSGGAGGTLRARQQGLVAAWDAVAVYSVDMRSQVCLTFAPEGCEFAQSEPLVLLDGISTRALAGAAGSPRLPDSFKCSYVTSTSSQASLRLNVAREVDLSAGMGAEGAGLAALAASGPNASFSGPAGSSARSAIRGALATTVARGSPLAVRISAPLVIINHTQLLLSVGMLALAAPTARADTGDPLSSAPSLVNRQASWAVDINQAVRVVDTDAFTSTVRPPGHILLSPFSLELMSLVVPVVVSDTAPAVTLSAGGSRWSPPLWLPLPPMMPEEGEDRAADVVANMGSGAAPEPVIMRMRGRGSSPVHDLVLHWETGMFKGLGEGAALSALRNTQVLHVEHQLVVNNRTGYPLRLLQPEATSTAASGSPATPLLAGASALPVGGPVRMGSATALGTTLVPAGGVGLPVSWHPASVRKLLNLALAVEQSPGSTALGSLELDSVLGWATDSFPISQMPSGVEFQLFVPLAVVGQQQDGSVEAGADEQVLQQAIAQAEQKLAVAVAMCLVGQGADGNNDSTATSSKALASTAPCWVFSSKARPGGRTTPALCDLHFVGVVVSAVMALRGPGCQTLELLSLGGEPAVAVANLTPYPLLCRERMPREPWHPVRPWSTRGWVRSDLGGMAALSPCELELCDALGNPMSGSVPTVVVALDQSADVASQPSPATAASSAGAQAVPTFTCATFTLGPSKDKCFAQASPMRELVTVEHGLDVVPGTAHASTALGGSGARVDTVLRVSVAHGGGSSGADAMPAVSSSAGGIHCQIEVSCLELSLIDNLPQELLLATLDGLFLEYHSDAGTSGSAGNACTQFALKLRALQVDDQLQGSPCPVMLAPLDPPCEASSNPEPLLYMMYAVDAGRRRNALYIPSCAIRMLPLRVVVSEGTLWRVLACLNALSAAASKQSQYKPSARSHEQVSVDLPLAINFLSLEDTTVRLSFKPDPGNRPRFANQFLSLSLDLITLEELPLTLPGLYLERARVQQSALQQMVISRFQERLMGIAFSVLRNANVLGSASKLFAVASKGMARLANVSSASSNKAAGGGGAANQEVGNLGEGVLEGGKAFARGLLQGAMGVITKPAEGAERGFSGFFEGVAKGVLGVAVEPLAGGLSAVSKVTAGVDATYGQVREQLTGTGARRTGRKRLARPFKGGVVIPFNLHAALGQALMHVVSHPAATTSMLTSGLDRRVLGRLTGLGPSDYGLQAAAKRPLMHDLYEDHFVLQGSRVLLLTNKRIALVEAPDFVALQFSVLAGENQHVIDVPGGSVLWTLSWDQMLTTELAWHQQQPGLPPDGVLVHRKQRTDTLVYDVRCRPQSQQAQEVLAAISKARSKFGVSRTPSFSPQLSLASADSLEGLPDVAFSTDFVLVWYSNVSHLRPAAQRKPIRTCSIWRPKGTAGYVALGDVAVSGSEPPDHAVRMYRLDRAHGGSARDAPSEGPRLTLPTGWALVYRDSAYPTITLWRPIPPRGYVEMGCVAWPETEEPPVRLVRCLRKDLVVATTADSAPLWAGTSSDNAYWRCSVWAVNNSSSTFVATKIDSKPPHVWESVSSCGNPTS